jgi:hypothetical protein
MHRIIFFVFARIDFLLSFDYDLIHATEGGNAL